jgi:polygalacturonase
MNKSPLGSPNQRRLHFTLLALFLGCVGCGSGQAPRGGDATIRPSSLNVVEFGAVGDGTKLNTASIQAAVDQCHKSGGGAVVVPAGEFVTGTILLKDNVTLVLNDGAQLIGSTEIKDYTNPDPFMDGVNQERGWCLVGAVDAKNIGLSGKGTIDGRGTREHFKNPRPFLVRFVRCDGVTVDGVTLQNPAAWTVHCFECEDVRISRVRINSHVNSNNDGIDIDSCRKVLIEFCDIDSGDDAICLKTTSPRGNDDITVRNCRLKSDWGAIKFGTESVGDFENVTITDCHIHDTKGGGIKILSVDGANIRNVRISDIAMEEVDQPIFVRLGRRLRTYRLSDKPRAPGTISDVSISNLRAKTSDAGRLSHQTAIFITGTDNQRIERLRIENAVISVLGGGAKDQMTREVPENPTAYPEYRSFGGALPAFGIYARHVKDSTITNVTITTRTPDERPLLKTEDVVNCQFDVEK